MSKSLKIVFILIAIMATPAIAQTPALVKELRLRAGMYYPDAKKLMLHQGWKIGAPKAAKIKYPEAPEVFCVRYAASDMLHSERCFVLFVKNEKAIILHVAPEKESLYVYAIFNEDGARNAVFGMEKAGQE
jgi:hypothetical protein